MHAPHVLGDSIDISSNALLILTNRERLKNGDLPLSPNEKLQSAASVKAKDMFAKNYWAHNSPNGETPWVFIKNAGYNYTYAGENLARGYTSSEDIVKAWMASPEHRANMLSKNYRDVGFAVEEGTLRGEQTVLVVEMFGGKSRGAVASNRKELLGPVSTTNSQQTLPAINKTGIYRNAFLDASITTEGMILLILGIFIVTLFLDLIIVRRNKIVRFAGHNIDHILFFGALAVLVFIISQAAIL